MLLPGAIRHWWRRLRRPLSLGAQGERAAARYLAKRGFKIIERSHRLRRGEIDLIAVEGRTIVFIEVKTRRSDDAGTPEEAVDLRKQRRLTRLALTYLKRHELLEYSSRFDVVAVTWPVGAKRPTIKHIRDAFPAVGTAGMYS